MRLSASNIGWNQSDDAMVMKSMVQMGFTGLEVAPTRLFPDKPYEKLEEAEELSAGIRSHAGLSICSVQSIWYGRKERIFGTSEERRALLDYSRQAASFAKAMAAGNLVFGNPKNRAKTESFSEGEAEGFFSSLGEIGISEGVVFAIEPNPRIYGTDFLNTTKEAADFVRRLDCPAIRLNLDFGTLLENAETLEIVEDSLDIINHLHISEPNLMPIRRRPEHALLLNILRAGGYKGYVSIEMKAGPDAGEIISAMGYLAGLACQGGEMRSAYCSEER